MISNSKLETLTSWHSDWKNLRVVILGAGVSGFSIADTLAELGSKCLVIAREIESEYSDLLNVIGVDAEVSLSDEEKLLTLNNFQPDVVITSPGFKPTSVEILWAVENKVPVWTDIDLAWRLRDKTGRKADWICVTGTNGKTTTVQLVDHILNTAGLRSATCGNIGTPILDCIRDEVGYDVLVVELSSFQLHYLGEIEPFASAILNIDEDHIDWHGTFDAYVHAKGKIFSNTESAIVYNTTDARTLNLAENADVQDGARAIGFGVGFPDSSCIGYVEDLLVDNAYSPNRKFKEIAALASSEQIGKIGVTTKHLLLNIAAAAALVRAYGVPATSVGEALATFELDHHRIELILDQDGVRWIDDSKATNPHAAAASLESFEQVVWVVGGLLKGVNIAPLVERFADRLAAAIVIGAERTEVLDALKKHAPSVPVIEITNSDDVMSQVVESAKNLVKAGDTVLLAPSSASMDQFKDYADRGTKFADAVIKLVANG